MIGYINPRFCQICACSWKEICTCWFYRPWIVQNRLQTFFDLGRSSVFRRVGNAVFVVTGICTQGRNEVRWQPGQESSLAPPCSNLRSFGSKFAVLKKVIATLLGLFGAPCSQSELPAVTRRPHSDSASWELCPLAPLVTPLFVL